MLLCDIGNSSFSFYKDGQVNTILKDDFSFDDISEKVYYICVEPIISLRLQKEEHWCDLAPLVDLNGSYDGLGIDRKLAVLGYDDILLIDAGSAITIDVMSEGSYQGGFIYPGFRALQKCYSEISSKLDFLLNFEVDLDKMAKNSQDAISYGAFKPIISEIKRLGEGKRVVVTGGDGAFLSSHLKDVEFEPHWLFKAMKKVISTKGKPC